MLAQLPLLWKQATQHFPCPHYARPYFLKQIQFDLDTG